MNQETTILVAEDDAGHATLLERNLKRAGLANPMIFFVDGKETLDFLLRTGPGPHRRPGESYLLLLDLRMPRIDGVEVLRQMKQSEELRKLPIIVVTTTDDPREVEQCHQLGCSAYITKPVTYDLFVERINRLGLFLSIVEVPPLDGE